MTEQKEKLKIPYKMGIGPEGIMTEEQFKEMQAKKARGDYTDINGNKMDAPVMTLTPEQFAKLDDMQRQIKYKKWQENRAEKMNPSKKIKAKKLEKVRDSMNKDKPTNKKPLPPKLKSLANADIPFTPANSPIVNNK